MPYTLIYYPGCSTCRNGLALLRTNGVEPKLRKYMDAGSELSVAELQQIVQQMNETSARVILRAKTATEFDLAPDADDATVYAAMAANPKLIQRPIGIRNGKAALGRPIEKLLDII